MTRAKRAGEPSEEPKAATDAQPSEAQPATDGDQPQAAAKETQPEERPEPGEGAGEEPDGQPKADEETPLAAESATEQAQQAEGPPPPEGERDVHIIDVLVDELALARAQTDAGMPALAEGTLRRRIAWLEASGIGGGDETDAARALLAEALWRQGRLLSARAALDGIRAGSPQRRLPIATIIEAEVLAAAGETDRAAGAVERVVDNVGVEESFALRAGTHGRATWPLPAELLPPPPRPGRPPWSSPYEAPEAPTDDARRAAARGRLEEARVAYVVGALERGDGEMSIAVRLDPSLAADGVAIIEPTLGGQPASDRLLLYGDLLRAAGRDAEADEAYDRAAERQG